MESKLGFDFKTTQAIIKKISFIDSFRGKWTGMEVGESVYLKELKRIATIESIGSSTRIEGSTLTDEEVEGLIGSVKVNSLKSRDEQEVIGYYEALNLILESFEVIEIQSSHIHHLHKSLLQVSDKDVAHRGEYKRVSNKVVATYPGGGQKVIFNTTPPFLVQQEMDSLISWTRSNFDSEDLHPLIIIAVFVYEFLSIHPYQDGNGRLSRLLTTLLLLKHGYDFMKYVSMELEIEKRKKEYYRSLMSGQRHRGTEEEIIGDWVVFFLETLETAIRRLESRYEQVKNKKSYLNDRQRAVVEFIGSSQPVKVSDIIADLPEYTSYSIKKDVRYLSAEGVIRKMGKGRGTIYILSGEE